MARSAGISIENNFTKGLITEVTGVNSPENSVLSSLDVVYDRKGRAKSRQSFRLEPNSSPATMSAGIGSGDARAEYVWETVNGVGSRTFLCTQVGSRVYFFRQAQTGALSAGYQSFSVDLTSYKVLGFLNADVAAQVVSFSAGRGYLFIAHPLCEPIYVRYNAGSQTITVTQIDVQIRDLEGVNDSFSVDQRPSSITNAHKYNLYNQGWYTDVVDGDGNTVNAFDEWDSGRSDYPSNSDVWWYYATTDQYGREVFDTSTVPNRTGLYGNTPAPKGHYIINAFDTNRSSVSGITAPETSSSGYRPSVVEFYAGRVFYAGVSANTYSSTVYFSQIVERDQQIGQCYQSADPTSREIFDLVDSDGGTVKIQDIAQVIDMRVVGQQLIIFATNGIWSISGTDNGSFKATDYSVSKVTSFPALSRLSIVDVGGTPVWWNYEGIYTLRTSDAGLTTDVTSLTDTTIKTFYTDMIPQNSKVYAKGAFNDQEGLIYWVWSTNSSSTYTYDRILVLDTVTGAFYPLSVPTGSFSISGVVAIRGRAALPSGNQPNKKLFKFLYFSGVTLTFAEILGTDNLDFSSISYSPDFITGHRVRGELIKNFQTNYLTVLTQSDINGSCYIQGIWDYANSPDTGRYTNPQQVYRFGAQDYNQCKIKIRGNGRSVRFHFFTEPGKSFTIIGWAGFETGNTVP